MGFAASQARLLLLTARKSDLEFRAQQITNAEMAIARQTETIASEYAMKLSNQTLKLVNNGDVVPFGASSLYSLSNGGLRLQVFVEGKWLDWNPAESSNILEIDDSVPTPNGDDSSPSITSSSPTITTPLPTDTLPTTTTPDVSGTMTTLAPTNEPATTIVPGLSPTDGDNGNPPPAGWSESWAGDNNDYTGAQILQGITNGIMRIVNADGEEIDPFSSTQFSVCYDTSDDAAADADYRSKTAALQVKEKRLQMELQQVEAQQKACDAEIESVKKIMDKNIDKAFKVFS